MASLVQIWNMALSHVGADANVTTISPPNSVEAGYCAQYSSQCRVELLEHACWHFSIKRTALAGVANESDVWVYAYAVPSDCLSATRVLDPSAADDRKGAEFEIESGVLYTDQEEAILVYVYDVTDTTKFTPLFTSAYGYLLASYIAGPVVKGLEGIKLAQALRGLVAEQIASAAASAANASARTDDYVPSSISARV